MAPDMTPVFWFTVVVQLITSAIVVGIAVQTQRTHTKNIEELRREKLEADVYKSDLERSNERHIRLGEDIARVRHDLKDHRLACDLKFKEIDERGRRG